MDCVTSMVERGRRVTLEFGTRGRRQVRHSTHLDAGIPSIGLKIGGAPCPSRIDASVGVACHALQRAETQEAEARAKVAACADPADGE